jgi:hypothetical protein
MTCSRCSRYVDTDFDLGSWGYDELENDDFYCEPCAEEVIEEMERDERARRDTAFAEYSLRLKRSYLNLGRKRIQARYS